MNPRRLRLAFLAAALAAPPAFAGEAKPDNGLPGVAGGHTLVAPAPQRPDDDAAGGGKAEGRGMNFQAGDFEVTVTGSVSVEIGFGDRPAGLRR